MRKTILGIKILGVAAAVVLAAPFANVSAETAKPPVCNSLKEPAACQARDDCQWIAAATDAKTGKEKRRAYCRRKPVGKKK